MNKILLYSGIAFFLSIGTVDAKSLYVNNSGSPACNDATTYENNSSSNPWCSLLRAVRGNSDGNRATTAVPAQAARAGDTVYVTAGTYNYAGSWEGGGWLSVLYDPVNSGTSGSWITFQAVGTVHLTGNTSGRAPMFGSNTGQYIEWNGFTVNQATSSYRNGLVAVNVDNVRLVNNTLIGIYTVFPQGDDNHPGIMVHGPRDGDCTGVVSNVQVINNRITGFTGDNGRNDAAMTLYCADDLLIENNEIYGNGNGVHSKSSYSHSANTPAVTIRYNLIRDNAGNGIATQSWSNWHVYQNLLLRNGQGMSLFNFEYYVGSNQPRGYRVVNNTLYGNNIDFRLDGFCQDALDMVFKNNIAYGATRSIWGESSACSTGMTKSNYDFDHNFYSLNNNLGELNYVRFSLPTWQSETWNNQDVNTISGDPLFINVTDGDLRLQAGSPARNAGVDILDLDNDGSTTDTITLGAYITGNEIIGLTTATVLPPSPPVLPPSPPVLPLSPPADFQVTNFTF